MENTPRYYALALLTVIRNQEGADGNNLPLGLATRVQTKSSIYDLAAHRLLQALIEHPPSLQANQVVAQEFLTELTKCGNSTVAASGDGSSTFCDTFYVEYYVQVNSLKDDLSASPDDWAGAVYKELRREGNISPLTDDTELASRYLNDLIIPCRVQCNICKLL